MEYFPGLTSLEIHLEDQEIDPEHVLRANHFHVNVQQDRLDTERKFRNMSFEFRTSQELHKKRFPRGHWSFFGQGEEEKWYGMHTYKHKGKWNKTLQRKWTPTIPRYQCVESRNTEKKGDVQFTSLRILRTQNFCFA